MAPLNLDDNQAFFQIRAYQPGLIQINDKTLTKSVIITPNQLIEDWTPQTVAELSNHSFDIIPSFKPDLLLVGTGATHIFLPADLYGELINQKIGVEVMNTGAACRTYNALSAEGRFVVAALLL